MNYVSSIKVPCLASATLMLLSLLPSLRADDTATGEAKEPIVVLSAFVVEDVPSELSIMPTSRPIDGLFGDGRNILDTPRSVSAITKEMLEMRGIDRVEMLGLLSPGVYSPSVYGVAGTATIRGDFGEMMQNGQRRRFQRLSYSPSFAPVESLDIVKGAGSVAYGPATRAGGLVNLVTKKPIFGKTETEVKIQMGDLVLGEGDSYPNFSGSIDSNIPVNDKLALRVQVGGREAQGWYRLYRDKNQQIFFAANYRPTSKLENEFVATFETFKGNESLGSNRISQEFIDHGIYVAGPAISAPDGTRAVVAPATAHKIYLPGYITITSATSGGTALRYSAQNILKYTISPDLTFRFLNMYEYLWARKFSTHTYQNYSPGNHLYDARAELNYRYEMFNGKVKAQTMVGGAFRYDYAKDYKDGADEVQNLYDLTAPPETYVNPAYPTFRINAGTSGYIPGKDMFTYRSVISQTAESTIQQVAPFIQQEVTFLNDKVTILGGLRIDRSTVDAKRPTLLNASGQAIATTGDATAASATVNNPTRSISAIFKAKPWMSLYYTYNYIESVQGDDFNAVTTIDGQPTVAGFQPIVNDQDLRVRNILYEVGSKYTLMDNKIFISTAVYRQERMRTDPITFVKIPFKVHGAEAEISFQPSVRFSVYANASYSWMRNPNFRPNPGTKNYLDQFPTNILVDGKPGTGLGSPNSSYNPYELRGNWHVPGTPVTILNVGSTYMFENGFGFTGNVQYIPSYSLNFDNTLHTRASTDMGLGVLYRKGKWAFKVNMMNALDERILTSVGSGSSNHIMIVEKSRRMNATASYRF
jgi:hypothetical protein